VGDSITYGADMDSAGIDPSTGQLMTYGWQIANRNGMTFYNKGVSGSTVAAGTNRNGFAEPNGRYTQLPDDIDYLTIWFGWNDYACISDNLETLGDINSTDTNSYYGAYNTVLPYLINKYPNTRIGLIVPFGANAGIRQAVRDLAKKWGLGYFDNYTGNTPLYYGKEDMSVLAEGLATQRRAIWQANGAHPSYAGHCQLATQIEAWLRTL
jgi:lysophospholipase L1-like esterase